jgi:hypothetical protein
MRVTMTSEIDSAYKIYSGGNQNNERMESAESFPAPSGLQFRPWENLNHEY